MLLERGVMEKRPPKLIILTSWVKLYVKETLTGGFSMSEGASGMVREGDSGKMVGDSEKG